MAQCTPKSFDLTGKVALITGASYGIGFAIATAMANCGAKIVFNDIKQELVDKGLAAYKEAGIDQVFVQDNQSASKKGVLRGLHFQINYPQDKLVRAIRGEVFDVAVDLRPGSKTYGQWYGVLLSEENKKQFFIPKNFAHGFVVLSDYAEFAYKCTDFYHPNDEGGLAWNDPQIGVEWPIPEGMELTLSDKDKKWGSFAEFTESRNK